ncbi:MAG: ParA family protein [Acidobacteriota bacterium]|nr:ParA family protein [Acidobacteriota bacterium]
MSPSPTTPTNALHARRIAIFNAKGGTGKTTTTHALAAGLGGAGKRVLVFDLDHQANLTFWFGRGQGGPTLDDVIRRDLPLAEAIQPTDVPGVELVAGSPWLVAADPSLRAKIGAELWLRRQLERLPARWDFILFDCPPGLGILTIAALGAAGEVLAPVQPQVLGLAGVARLLETLEQAREGINPDLRLLGIVPVMVDRRLALTGEVLEQLRLHFGPKLLGSAVGINVRLAEAPSHAKPIYEYAPHSAGAVDYRALTQEVLAHDA